MLIKAFLNKYKHWFDFSEYKSKPFDLPNKKVIDKMTDEFKGIPINKFIGLKWKMFLKIVKTLTQERE